MQTPHELAEIKMRKSAEYSRLSEQLGEILEVKAKAWESIRTGCTSDKQADQKWNSSEHGIKEMKIRLQLKSLEKEMSSISTFLRVLDTEARNLT